MALYTRCVINYNFFFVSCIEHSIDYFPLNKQTYMQVYNFANKLKFSNFNEN